MKKYILLSLFLFQFTSCNNDSEKGTIVLEDYGYEWEFVVVNETESTRIDITQDYPYGPFPHIFALAPGENDLVWEKYSLGGKADKPMQDEYENEAWRLSVGGFWPVDSEDESYPFTMTIDGKEVSSEIWLRKYWSFESTFYTATYTLTVTDELLAELAEAGE